MKMPPFRLDVPLTLTRFPNGGWTVTQGKGGGWETSLHGAFGSSEELIVGLAEAICPELLDEDFAEVPRPAPPKAAVMEQIVSGRVRSEEPHT